MINKLFLTLFFFCWFCSNSFADQVNCAQGPESYLPVSAQTSRSADTLSSSTLLAGALDCGWGVLKGAWDATGGLVAGAANCIWSPIECAQSARTAFNNAKHFITNIVQESKAVINGIRGLPASEKVNLICSIIGSIGADVLIAILTAGAASGKLGITIANIVLKVTKIAGIFRRVAYLPAKLLGKMSKVALGKVDELVQMGFGPMLKRRLRPCM
ncbi:MAG: hypothetical protein COW01_14585 [Bdellovibrionales bacterium CG12_big_fil_rev_8_21_14_0_65_38_15]|nr:MAG: hypothetical protein COW79_10295 [Bdellovibrionales bacterium CG22_combo_CG10-13_8_21_14_all_38_13]PIQ53168.1 MAG: hypothetical protein COW01_14585 [Bdellovibrionales bacterium CG12_big_fil_rev_8_21_14_0_65_38_15]PIR29419.1 MAG: hypothetical protein COV38_10770 [Bdellovibrionales bacterium CG11_big_fil_rev_8_21_14_0_20_38_13]